MKRPQDAYTIGHALGVNFWITMPADHNRLVPIGTPGELLVEGPHLGRGYLNDSDKTSTAFVHDPQFVSKLCLSPSRRMYRTGDIVQQNSDGSLVHLGRIDTQIKIRGQRVEPGEIESNIVRLEPAIRIACVDLIRSFDAPNSPLLVAAVDVGDFGRDQDTEEADLSGVRRPTDALCAMIRDLRAKLLLALPRYMIPHFVPMASLPLNASSKLDKKATRAILERLGHDQLGAFERTSDESDSRPLSSMEEKLRSLWVEVLDCSPNINAQDDFIQLGGDSVVAMRLVAAARRVNLGIGVADILQNPRLSDLAQAAESYNSARNTALDPAPFDLWSGYGELEKQDKEAWLSKVAGTCGVAVQDIEDVYPATPLQEALMAVTAQQPGAFVAQNVFRMRGVDLTRFKESWSTLVQHLSFLRTRIVYQSARSGSVQVVVRSELDWYQSTNLQTYLAEDKSRLPTYGTPLHRLALIEESPDKVYFVWTQHHSGYDGYQMALTLNMLAQVYQGGNQSSQQFPPPTRFIKYLQQKDKQEAVTYWKDQLHGAPPTRFPPLPHPSFRPQADAFSQRRMKCSKSQSHVPVAVLLRAAWAMVVAAYTGSTEATSTVALSGRDIPVADIGNIMAPTLTTVPLRTRLDDREQTVSELLDAMRLQNEELKPFLHTGLQHIRAAVPELGFDFDPGHVFMVQPTLDDKDKDPLFEIGLEELPTDKSGFGADALSVECTVEADGAVSVDMRYDSRLLPGSMVDGLLSQFEHNLQQLDVHRDTPIGNLDLFKPNDVQRVEKWNEPVLNATASQSSIHELVQKMIEAQPDAQAVTSWDGDLSYAELGRYSCQLAHHLTTIGVGPEVAVGICMDKSLWAVVSALAILQAGGVVVGLGSQYPLNRIENTIKDAGIRVVLVDKFQSQRLDHVSNAIVVNEAFIEQLPTHHTVPDTGVAPSNAAWIIYTSGSPGMPKGVVLEHQALCTGILAHGKFYGNGLNTRALQFASHTFGVAIEDMFTTLIFGGCTCIPSEDERLDMSALSSAICRMDVNFVNLTSTSASMLDPNHVPNIDTVVLGGEAVRPAVVDRWVKHAKIFNSYGQSECSVESVISCLHDGQDATNIGLPIADCAAWVVDPIDCNKLVPVGAPGELLVQGPLLARGYLNDAALTASTFVHNPDFFRQFSQFSTGHHRVYRTGDLVQQNHDGSLVYIGRLNAQIKVHGQRVEPGEIESHLVQNHAEISHAYVGLVMPAEAPESGDPVLVAALQFRDSFENDAQVDDDAISPSPFRQPNQELTAKLEAIRGALLSNLAPYMVPRYFVPMAGSLPVNASGKLDRRATNKLLETLSLEKLRAFSQTTKQSDRPLSETEETLRAAFAEILGFESNRIGVDDRFFQLGGDSVAAIHVVASCRQRGILISVRDLLQKQSIAALALCVQTSTKVDSAQSTDGIAEESSAVTDIQEWALNYHVARPDVGMTYFALDAAGPLDGDRMLDACRKLIATVEPFHTGFVVEDGKWKRVVPSTSVPKVHSYHIDSSIDEWTEEYMLHDGFNPLEPGKPLASIAICATEEQHRILVRLSHAVWDGMIIGKIWSSLRDLYLTGQTSKVASFSRYMAQVERNRTAEATAYWSNLLSGSKMTSITKTPPQEDGYVFRAGVVGPKVIDLGHNLPDGVTCATLVKASWALVLARYAKSSDVVFADLVSGRAGVDSSVSNAIGCCSTPMPVRVRLDPTSTYSELVRAVQTQQLNSIPHETYGFSSIVKQCTDWPAHTVASTWINHVPKRIASHLDIGGADYTISQPKQEEQQWTFSEARISYLDYDNKLEFNLAYAVDRIPEETAQWLYKEMGLAVERILTSPDNVIGGGL